MVEMGEMLINKQLKEQAASNPVRVKTSTGLTYLHTQNTDNHLSINIFTIFIIFLL
jgi:hypothetical protein